jgi:hypothetical protein
LVGEGGGVAGFGIVTKAADLSVRLTMHKRSVYKGVGESSINKLSKYEIKNASVFG